MSLRQLSIKQRLLLSGFVMAIGMIIMLALKVYQTQQSNTLAQAQQTIAQLQTDVLTLRRHEKDFMLRLNPDYLARFEVAVKNLQHRAEQLRQRLIAQQINDDQLNQFLRNIRAYQALFNDLIAEYERLGLDENSGLQGELRAAVHRLEQAFNEQNNNALQVEVLMLRRHEKDFMLRLNPDYQTRLATTANTLANAIDALPNATNQNQLFDLLLTYQDAFDAYVAGRERIGLNETSGIMGDMRDAVHATETNLEELTAATTATLNAIQTNNERWSYSIFAVLLVCILSFIFLTSRSIIQPLMTMVSRITTIADDSDLTVRMSEQGNDELTLVNRRFNEMMTRFQTLVSDLTHSADPVAASSEQLSAVSEEVSNIALEQEQQTSMIATAITQMAAAVQEVATNAQGASQSADEADHEAKSGYDKVQANIAAIEALAGSVAGTSERLQVLNERTNEISSVVEVIQAIAEQTKILALNPAIEAARAGEQGRGFAVVADEVRALAANTKKSTETIQATTQRLLRGATEATEAMQVSHHQAEESVTLARESGQAFRGVSNAVSKVVDVNIQISTATEQQTAVANDITENVNGLAGSIREVVTGASQCAEASHQLSSLASDLKQQVNRFKVA